MKASDLKKGCHYKIVKSNHLYGHFSSNTEIEIYNIIKSRIYWEAKNQNKGAFDVFSLVGMDTEFESIEKEYNPLIFN